MKLANFDERFYLTPTLKDAMVTSNNVVIDREKKSFKE